MEKLSHDSARLTAEYGIEIGRWAQYPGNEMLPFDAMWCVIPPGGRSEPDCHPEVELAVVASGAAAFESPEPDTSAAGPLVEAPQGAAVLLAGGERHVVHNRSGTAPLVLLSVYWLPEGGDPGTEAGR